MYIQYVKRETERERERERERARARVNRSSLQSAQRKDQRNFVQNLFKVYFKKSQQSISSNKISFFIHIKVREGESGHLNMNA